jgi:hypothetical protein
MIVPFILPLTSSVYVGLKVLTLRLNCGIARPYMLCVELEVRNVSGWQPLVARSSHVAQSLKRNVRVYL